MCEFGCDWCLIQEHDGGDEDTCNDCHECMRRIEENSTISDKLGVYRPKKGDTPEMIQYGEFMSMHLDGKNVDFHPMLHTLEVRLEPKVRIRVVKNLTQMRMMVIIRQNYCFDSVYRQLKSIVPAIYFGDEMEMESLRQTYLMVVNTWLMLNTFTPYDVALIFMIHILHLKGCPPMYLIEIDNCYWTSVTNVRKIKAEYNQKLLLCGLPPIPLSFRNRVGTSRQPGRQPKLIIPASDSSDASSSGTPGKSVMRCESFADTGITLSKSNVLSKSTITPAINPHHFFDLFPILSVNGYTAWDGKDVKKWEAYDKEALKVHSKIIDHDVIGSQIKFGSTFTSQIERVAVSRINNAFIALYVFVNGVCYHVKVSNKYIIVLNCPKIFETDKENSNHVTKSIRKVLRTFTSWAKEIRSYGDFSNMTMEQFIAAEPCPCPPLLDILSAYYSYTCNDLTNVYNSLIAWGGQNPPVYKTKFSEVVNVVYNSSFNMTNTIIAFPLIAERLQESFRDDSCKCFLCENCNVTIRYQNVSRAKDLMATIKTSGHGVVDKQISLKLSSIASATIFSTATTEHIHKATNHFKLHVIRCIGEMYPTPSDRIDICNRLMESAKKISLCVNENPTCNKCNLAHYACKKSDSDILTECEKSFLDEYSCEGKKPESYIEGNIILRNKLAEIKATV